MSTNTILSFDSARMHEHTRGPVSELTIIAADHELANRVAAHVKECGKFSACNITNAESWTSRSVTSRIALYFPSLHANSMRPDLHAAENLFKFCKNLVQEQFVLVASAAIYGASFRNPGLVSESYRAPSEKQGIASDWKTLEEMATSYFGNERLTVLRCATILSPSTTNRIARRFTGRISTTMPGHDPSLQLLSPNDLAQAIVRVLQTNSHGVFNVAPDAVIPLRKAITLAGVKRVPLPRTLLRTVHRLRGRQASSYLDYLRYSWTISNEKLKAIGFTPEKSSAEALREFCNATSNKDLDNTAPELEQFDDFGMDKKYIAAHGRTLFRFLADWYWRIETAGLEHIPRTGRAVLAGVHRGFMPWDGVVALDLIVKNVGRYPRFLIHPGLVKFPFLANFMTKLGGVIACQENARRILENDELLGVFPEGIKGAFVRYSSAYRIHDFHRDAFVKMALRHRAPIIPFVTVGSAEIFPILAKLQSRLWTKYSEWPAFPITPTFPLIPLPLPSKWHTRFLKPLHIENDYPPSAAANPAVVRAISCEVRDRMQQAIDEMLQRRKSVFFGSVFAVETKEVPITAE